MVCVGLYLCTHAISLEKIEDDGDDNDNKSVVFLLTNPL